jgi:hypothetical protein
MITYELRCGNEDTSAECTVVETNEDPLVAKNTKCPDCNKPYLIARKARA